MGLKNYYWYVVTVQIITEDEETGRTKKIKEVVLVKAVNVTDAESQVVSNYEDYNFEYRILNVTESKIIKIIKPDGLDLNE